MMDSLKSVLSAEFFTNLLDAISFNRNFSNFTYGVLNLANTVFFLSVVALFLFLTVRVFEKRRWS